MTSKTDPANLDSIAANLEDPQKILDAVARRPTDLDKWFKATYASKAEADWAGAGPMHLYGKFGSHTVFSGYEWLGFSIPGGRYTPDFFHILEDGRFVIVEVKGSKKQGSYRDSRARLRVAASLNPWAIFVMALKSPTGGGWELEIIKPKGNLIAQMVEMGLKSFYGLGQ